MPWKATTIRLDTYSGARVDFAAYAVDPAEVIVAGASRSARAIDTSRLKPAIRWSFSPPQGYRFVTSNVPVPLGSSEGFFVIEARRGDAAQQVWLNRTRIGLLSKESPEGLVIWGADLRTGHALRGLHVALLVGSSLVTRVTDNAGLLTWRGSGRPVFALADSGGSRAFLSFLPQAPVAPAVVAVRVASAVVRTGDTVHVVGFARRRTNGVYRRATGDARLTLVGHGRTIASADPSLDGAGAFVADLRVPEGTEAGDYALLASAGDGGVGGNHRPRRRGVGRRSDDRGDLPLQSGSGYPRPGHRGARSGRGRRHPGDGRHRAHAASYRAGRVRRDAALGQRRVVTQMPRSTH